MLLLGATLTSKGWPARRALWSRAALIALAAMALALPWLANLGRELAQPLSALPVRAESGDEYNAVPWVFLQIGHGPALLKLAGVALLWWFARCMHSAARALRTRLAARAPLGQALAVACREALAEHPVPALLLGWVALTGLLINLRLVGLPDIGVVNNASAIIALYLPLSLLAAYLAGDLLNMAASLKPAWRTHLTVAAGLALMLWSVAGARDMVTVINPSTILATREDVEAMAWIRDNTPPDAIFLINTSPWQRGMYMGSDGGWWIPILTDRQATLPAVVYWGGDAEYVARITRLAEWASTTPSLDDATAWQQLREAGATHVYIGAKGGNLKPEMMDGKPGFTLAYHAGPVYIYEVAPGPP